MDSRASFNMILHKEWLSSFRPCERGTILLKDDGIYKVEGIDKGYIKSNTNIMINLDNVGYVPQLKRNILSVHVFDNVGFEGR